MIVKTKYARRSSDPSGLISPIEAGALPALATMITKEILDNQLFVFCNTKLIYKRWLKTGQSMVFHVGEGLTLKSRKT